MVLETRDLNSTYLYGTYVIVISLTRQQSLVILIHFQNFFSFNLLLKNLLVNCFRKLFNQKTFCTKQFEHLKEPIVLNAYSSTKMQYSYSMYAVVKCNIQQQIYESCVLHLFMYMYLIYENLHKIQYLFMFNNLLYWLYRSLSK